MTTMSSVRRGALALVATLGLLTLAPEAARAQFGLSINTPGASVGIGTGAYGYGYGGGVVAAPVVVPAPVIVPRPVYGGYGYGYRPVYGGYGYGHRGPYGYGPGPYHHGPYGGGPYRRF